ncbi:ATP-dependent RNA helicase [Skeletonema marinoi]|uniref:RNA helicase n=1 Tax=Skeletonema marinoi TaxID=267567 RepID=A0AAD8YLF9_9STRA|nr:ATP-dependent RNA helicase [Skeletonema marinoi]
MSQPILPIAAHRTQILYALEKFGVVIIVGETGCGKSTMLPRYFYENGWADSGDGEDNYREIICTQPRRIAAITLANRVSQELHDSSGTVGYSVRFSSTYNPGTTKIRYVTDGWLLRETLLLDPLLKRCSVLIIDEAHERSLNTDLLLGVVKKIRRVRPDLRLVVCSATLDAEAFLDFFVGKKQRDTESKQRSDEKRTRKRKSRWGRIDDISDATKRVTSSSDAIDTELRNGTIISVDGRQHSVDIMYIKEPVSDYIQSTIEIALQIHDSEIGDGDILCFLPTGEDIDRAVEMADNMQIRGSAVFLPLYSSLSQQVQSQIFLQRSDDELKNKTRRIIFATNIAETSVTVPRIAHVIDCGFAKMPFFDPYSGFDRLIVCPISRASAQQRAGRAGRVRSGKCYRLYSEKDFQNMEVNTAPEIQRCQLSTLIMTIKALGVHNVLSFDLLSMPSSEALSHGLESLSALGAIDDKAELTELGKEMIYFPTDPRVSRMLLASLDMESREGTSPTVSKLIVGDILTVAAALQVKNLFFQPRSERQWRAYDDAISDILDRSGDHLTMVHLFDLCDHSKKILSEDECRERFVNRVALKRALDVRSQLARFLSRRFGGGSNWFGSKRQELVGSNGLDTQERSDAIRKCVCAGYFMNAAKLGNDGCYYTLRGGYAVSISSASVLHRYGESSDYVVFGETFDGSSGGVDVMPCSSISGLWLQQLAPHYWVR